MSFVPWLVIALLTGINALYVAAEFAVVAARRSQLMPLVRAGQRRALTSIALLEDGRARQRYIAACQLGITLTSLVAGAYAQSSIARGLGQVLESAFSLQSFAAQSGAALIVLISLTVLQVVLGELVPKSLALQFPERVLLAMYMPMRWSVWLFRAFIALVNGSSALLLRPFGVRPGGHQHVHSPEELELLFAESRRGGTLSPEMYRRLQHGLRLSQRTVHQLMVPRGQLLGIEASMPHAEIVRRVLESPYSRLPVYRGTIDQLLGSVSTKDIVASYLTHGEIPSLAQLLRPMPMVPEKLRADHLVRLLRQERTSKAIVVDEFGGVQGMISIDDLLAELFGDFGDELKEAARASVELLRDGRVKLPGSMRPAAAEPWLGGQWEGTAATVGGLVVSRLGRLPSVGERLDLGGAEITVLEVTPTTVVSIAVRPLRRSAAPGEESRS